jgi:hypothetical protein
MLLELASGGIRVCMLQDAWYKHQRTRRRACQRARVARRAGRGAQHRLTASW